MNEKKESEFSRYLKATNDSGVLFVSSFICGVAAVFTSIIFTSTFGLGKLTDAYFMGFSILLGFNKLFRQGTFSKIYISLFVPLIQEGRVNELKRVFIDFQSLAVMIFGLFALVLIAFAPWVVGFMAPGFDAFTAHHTVNIMRFLMLTMVYSVLCTILISVYHSYHKFSLPAIVQTVPFLVSFATAVLFLKTFGIYSMIIAFLIGSLLHLFLLYSYLPFAGATFNPRANPLTPEAKKIWRLVFPFYLSEIVMQALLWVQNILSSLLAPGTVTILVLARKVQNYFVEYVLTPLPVIIYPSLIKKIKDKNSLSDLALKGIRMSSFVILPAVIWFICMSYQLIRIIFQRGNFSPEAANSLAAFLIIFSIDFVFEAVSPILTKILYGAQKTGWINLIRFTERAVNVILSLLLFKSFGFLGLAWAVVFGAVANFILTCFYVSKIVELRSILFNRPLAKIILNIGFMLVMTVIFNNFLSLYLSSSDRWQQIMQVLLVVSVSGSLYVGVARLMKIDELSILFNVLRLKFQKARFTPSVA